MKIQNSVIKEISDGFTVVWLPLLVTRGNYIRVRPSIYLINAKQNEDQIINIYYSINSRNFTHTNSIITAIGLNISPVTP